MTMPFATVKLTVLFKWLKHVPCMCFKDRIATGKSNVIMVFACRLAMRKSKRRNSWWSILKSITTSTGCTRETVIRAEEGSVCLPLARAFSTSTRVLRHHAWEVVVHTQPALWAVMFTIWDRRLCAVVKTLAKRDS